MSEQEIQSRNAHVMKPDVKDDISYQLYRHEEEKSRASYEVELQWMNRIENGIFEEDADSDMEHASWQAMEQIGTMAMDDFKQMEYMAVSSITLKRKSSVWVRLWNAVRIIWQENSIILSWQELRKL